LEAGNTQAMSESAHALKSAAANLQASAAASAAAQLESTARSGDSAQIAGLADRLRNEVNAAVGYLKSRLA
jgi:HPt (histidine-containing phosphotransfer) domain-containing protein